MLTSHYSRKVAAKETRLNGGFSHAVLLIKHSSAKDLSSGTYIIKAWSSEYTFQKNPDKSIVRHFILNFRSPPF